MNSLPSVPSPTRSLAFLVVIMLFAAALLILLALLGVNFKSITREISCGLMANSQNTVLVEDNFSGGPGKWTPNPEEYWKGKWTVSSGMLTGSSLGIITLSDFSEENYVIELTYESIRALEEQWNGFGVLFRTNGKKMNGYSFEIEKRNPEDPGFAYLRLWANGYLSSNPLEVSRLPENFDWSAPGSMRVVVFENQIRGYLNNQLILDTTDATYAEGSAGILINQGTEMTVSEYKVTRVPCGE